MLEVGCDLRAQAGVVMDPADVVGRARVLAPFAVGDVDVSPLKKRRLRHSFGHRRHCGL